MAKALSYKLLGLGGIPRRWRPLLEQDGILVADEGMPGWFIAHNVKGPGKRYWRRAEGFSGCLVVTLQRILCFTYWKCQINISAQDPRLAALQIAVPEPNRLLLYFESAVFRTGWQGIFEYRFVPDQPCLFLAALQTLRVQGGKSMKPARQQ